jgi:hypothetical protein
MLRVKHSIALSAALLGSVVAGTAFSAEIAAETLACQTQALLERYQELSTAGEKEFTRDMRERAQCYITGRSHKVLVHAEAQGLYNVELLSGHKVWVPAVVDTPATNADK